MSTCHIIEEAVFDISFGSEEEAFETQAGLDSFIMDRLMQVVDDVFNEYSDPEFVWRIEPFEIDLGTMEYRGYQDEMERRLREQLKRLLQRKLESLKVADSPSHKIVSRQAFEREQIEYFLQHGHLPWNADLKSNQTIDQMFRRVIQFDTTQLLQFLKASPQRETVVKRLVTQFSALIPDIVLQGLAPSQVRLLRECIDELRRVLKQTQLVGKTEKDVSVFVWEHLIDEWLQREELVFDKERLIARIVNIIAGRRNEEDAVLVTLLLNTAVLLEEKEGHPLELTEVLAKLKRGKEDRLHAVFGMPSEIKTFSPVKHDEKSIHEGKSHSYEWLHGQLVEALGSGKAKDIMDVWPLLVRDQQNLLKRVLRHEGQQAKVRRKIAHGFPESMIQDIVGVLEPGGSRFIQEIVQHHELFRRDRHEQSEEEETQRRPLWECTLTYLLVEQESRFNKKSYLVSLIRQMAAHHNIPIRDLFRSLAVALKDMEVSHMLRTEMLQLLNGLEEGLGTKSQKEEKIDDSRNKQDQAVITILNDIDEKHESQSRLMLHVYNLYSELWKKLEGRSGGRAVKEETLEAGKEGRKDVDDLVNELEREAPWLLLRLYRELQTGTIPADVVADQLSEKGLCRLIQAFVSLAPGMETPFPNDLLQAIEFYAAQAGDMKRYYASVLDCLLQNTVIDFKAIIFKTLGLDQKEMQAQTILKGKQQDDTGMADEIILLRSALRQDVMHDIVRLWPHLRREQPAQVKTVLQREGQQASVRRMVAYTCPESLIEDMIELLEPHEHGFIDAIVHRPELFHQVWETKPKEPERARRQLWEFTLTYLVVGRGNRFNRKAYLGSLVRQMAAHANIRYADLLGSLTMALQALTTPQTLQVEMLELLGELQEELSLTSYSQQIQEEKPVAESFVEDWPDDWSVQRNMSTEERLVQCLGKEGELSSREASWLVSVIERMLVQQPGQLRRLIRTSFDDRDIIGRIIDHVSETLLIRLLFLLRPAEAYLFQEYAEDIANACRTKDSMWKPAHLGKLKWKFIFRYVIEEDRRFDEKNFVSRFVTYLTEQGKQLPAKEFHVFLSQQLALNILPSTRERHVKIMETLSQMDKERLQSESPMLKAASSEVAFSLEAKKEEWGEEVYIANAGQVIASPYLPRLFTMLNLTEASAFKDREAAERAIHLLQFMVNESTNSPEYQLVLNKILCGVETGIPIARDITVSNQEKETIEGLIKGMIQHWKIIGNTSIAGFRESFLQREGKLSLKEDVWHLLVEPRPFDLLLDQIPWSFSTIRFPWMERVLYVEWR